MAKKETNFRLKKISTSLLLFLCMVSFVILTLIFPLKAVRAEIVEITEHNVRIKELRETGKLNAEVIIDNFEQKRDFWLGYSLRDPQGVWYDLEPQNITIGADSSRKINFEEKILKLNEVIPGDYHFVTALWDSYPDEEANRLTENRKQTEINNGSNESEGRSINEDLRKEFSGYDFLKATHRLGKGWLHPDNIIQDDDIIKLLSPENSYQGGEIRTEKFFGYGSYRVVMKTDYAPGSFAAFFLYEDVEGDNDEIDIEIYNDGSWQIDFVTFTQGEKTNYKSKELSFDPASDFHEYRIDYFPEEISFYVEEEFMVSFDSQLPSSEMRVMINHWWPKWLEVDQKQDTSKIKIKEIDLQEF